MLANDLRRHVAWSSAENFETLVVGDDDAEAEIDQLDHAGAFLNQDVVQFDISVDDIMAMEVCN